MLKKLDEANRANPHYLGWARHSYNDYLVKSRGTQGKGQRVLLRMIDSLSLVSSRRFPVYYFRQMENDRKDLKRPITYWIGEGAGWLLQHVVSGLAATGITPNMFTFFGLGRELLGRGAVCHGPVSAAAARLFFAGFLDMADGQVARRVGRVTAFGAFLDSTLDRYSDLALYMGLVVYYTLIGRPSTWRSRRWRWPVRSWSAIRARAPNR